MPTVTLEEHFLTPELQRAIARVSPPHPAMAATQKKLADLGEGRIAAMDAGGVDVQVLSVAALGLDLIPAAEVTALVHDANDQLAEAIRTHPTRFAGFASVDLLEPEAAVREFERCIAELGFCGLLVDGHSGGAFLDDPRFLPLWETAARLGVPVYLHPAPPPRPVFETYYTGLPHGMGQMLSIAGWGWHVELGLHVLRLMLAGLFDRFPHQQLIIGHMGEDLPYSLARAASVLGRGATYLERTIPEYFHQNVHVTTSGYFTQPPFRCALEVVGIDRLLYSVDYPFSETTTGQQFLAETGLDPEDMLKLTYRNAVALLKLKHP